MIPLQSLKSSTSRFGTAVDKNTSDAIDNAELSRNTRRVIDCDFVFLLLPHATVASYNDSIDASVIRAQSDISTLVSWCDADIRAWIPASVMFWLWLMWSCDRCTFRASCNRPLSEIYVLKCLEGRYQLVVICYASDVIRYDRRKAELYNAKLHMKQDNDSIEKKTLKPRLRLRLRHLP